MGARRGERDGRPPNLILAGVSRCGTTSLYSWLGSHPDIRPGAIKAHPYFRQRLFESDPGGLESYLENFAGPPCRVLLDGHGGYCDLEPSVLAALKDTLPEARILIVLREPVARAISYYRYIHSRFHIDRGTDFGAYLEGCLGSPRADRRTPLGIRQAGVSVGEYARWLPAWQRAWGPALRVVFFDDLRADPRGFVGRIVEWLGLEPDRLPAFDPASRNPSVGFRWAWLHRQAIRTNERFEAFFRRHPRLKAGLRAVYQRGNAAPAGQAIAPEAAARLARHYAEANRDLPRVLADLGVGSWPAWVAAGASPRC